MESIEVGSHIEVTGKGLRGVVAYIGSPSFASGKWVGITLSEASGKNDGSVKGERYFTCEENHGMFVRMSQLSLLVGGEYKPSSNVPEARRTGIRVPASRLPSVKRTPKTALRGSPKSAEGETLKSSSSKTSSPALKSADKTASSGQQAAVKSSTSPKSGAGAVGAGDFKRLTQLETENVDLKQKFDTIMIKRMEDKNKIKSFQKAAIQLEQMMEYKQKSQEQTIELQKQLQASKKEKKELQESFNSYKDEMADVNDTIEMITLDKIMAEEKSESYQMEITAITEKLEETTLDFQILKEEINNCDNPDEGVTNSYQVKQLEQQKERLQDAIIKLRDASFEEKTDYQKLQKEFTSLNSDYTSSQKDKARLQLEITAMEEEALEYTEQIDVAQGASEMVEKLTEKILEHDEAMRKLQEEKADLEDICEVNDELQESVRETELELREDLEQMKNRVRLTSEKYDESVVSGQDYMTTIEKFRKQVFDLQTKNDQLIDGISSTQNTMASSTTATVANQNDKPSSEVLRAKLSDAKSLAFQLDLELRTLERDHLTMYVQCLANFCPDSFRDKFGNNDSIGITIILPRMISKANLLIHQITEQIDIPDTLVREQVLFAQQVKLYIFIRMFLFKLSTTVLCLNRFNFAIRSCSLDSFREVIKVADNIHCRESVLDCFIDLLRNNKLDERVSTDSVYGLQAYFKNLQIENISDHKDEDARQCLLDNAFSGQAAFDCASQNISCLKLILNVGLDSSDACLILKEIDSNLSKARTFVRKVKKVVVNEKGGLAFHNTDTSADLQTFQKQLLLLVMCLNSAATACLHKITIMTENIGLPSQKLLDQLNDSFKEHLTTTIEDKDLRSLSESIVTTCTNIWNSLDCGDIYVTSAPKEKVMCSAIELLAEQVKANFGTSEEIHNQLEKSQQDNLKLKILIKTRQDEINEKILRMELAEGRILATQAKTGQLKMAQKQLEDNENNSNNKQREYEEALDALQTDNQMLEEEKSDLRDQVKLLRATSKIVNNASAKEKKLTNHKQLTTLMGTLTTVIQENATLKGNRIYNQLTSLGPLKSTKPNLGLDKLRRDTNLAVHEYYKCLAGSAVVDISKRVPGEKPVSSALDPLQQLLAMKYHQSELRSRASLMQCRLFSKLSESNQHNHVKTKSTTFPTWQYNQAMNNK